MKALSNIQSMGNDRYPDFKTLKMHHAEGSDFCIEYEKCGSGVLVMAPHGGLIEPMTSEIAKRVAVALASSFYSFCGSLDSGNFDLHITSDRFDEPIALELTSGHSIVCTIHGCRGNTDLVYVGGGNADLRNSMISELRENGFLAPDFSENPFKGESSNNICNKGAFPGIQLELSRSLRDRFRTDEFSFRLFIDAVCNVLRRNAVLSQQ